MGKNRSLEKGKRGEREICRYLKEKGISAKRVPLSGGTEFQKGDVVIEEEGLKLIGEVKLWSKGFSALYKMLEGRDILFCRGDRKEWLIVMKVETFLKIRDRLMDQEIDLNDYAPDHDF